MKTTRKIWSMVLCMCLVIAMLCIMPAAATDAYADWTFTNGQVKPDGNSPEGGNYLELTADYGNNITAAAQKNYFDITPGKLNVLSFYYKSGVDGLAQLTMYERKEDNTSNGTYTLRLPGTGDKWEKCSYGFVPEEDGVKVTLRLLADYQFAEKANVVCYDGVKVEEVADGVMTIPAGETGYHGLSNSIAEKDDKIMVTGQIKVGADEAVKIAVQLDSVVSEEDMASKNLTTRWQDFSVSGITYLKKGTALKLVAGTSALSLQKVKFEKDANLLPEASMEDTSKIGWDTSYTWVKTNTIDGKTKTDDTNNTVGYKTDGNCPDGNSYLYMGEGTSKGYIYLNRIHTILDDTTFNKRYLFSVWYKTSTDKGQIRIIQRDNTTSKVEHFMPHLKLANTNGEWRRLEVVIERTPMELYNFQIQLGTITSTQKLSAGEYVCFDAVSLVPLAEGKLGFYNDTTTLIKEDDNNKYSLSDTYSNVLGDAVDTLDGATEVTAVYADGSINSVSANKISTKSVLLAAYNRDSNNVLQLTDVSFSTVDAAATTVQYPTATLDVSGLSEGTEIRVFVWDDISGLRPLEKAVATTK